MLAELGRTQFGGELSVQTAAGAYIVTLADGRVVNAATPTSADSFAAVAMAIGLLTAEQMAEATRMHLRTSRDEIGRLIDAAKLTAEQTARLRRETILRRAARILSVTRAEVRQSTTTTLTVTRHAVDVPAVVYYGARAHLSDEHLSAAVRGGLQVERADWAPYGFGPEERAIVADLQRGATWVQIEASHANMSQRALRAIAYALHVCERPSGPLAQGSGELIPPPDGTVVARISRPRAATHPAVVEVARDADDEDDDR